MKKAKFSSRGHIGKGFECQVEGLIFLQGVLGSHGMSVNRKGAGQLGG